MMERPTCRTCPYFEAATGQGDAIGVCLYAPPGVVPLVSENPLRREPVILTVPYHPPVREKTFCSNHPSSVAWEQTFAATHHPKYGVSSGDLSRLSAERLAAIASGE